MVRRDALFQGILFRRQCPWPKYAPIARSSPFFTRPYNSNARPPVLEKPEKFNPPSHGARLRNPAPRYYGPQMTEKELNQQKKKKYPNMMPPEGSFMHWFLHNKMIHLWISLGTLTTLAVTVMVTNFKRDSPFADMLPEWYNLFLHPIRFWRTVFEVIKLDTARISAETAERRKHRVDDVAKRAAYRKSQGLDKFEGIGGWTAKDSRPISGSVTPTDNEDIIPSSIDQDLHKDQLPIHEESRVKRPLKKWLGIW